MKFVRKLVSNIYRQRSYVLFKKKKYIRAINVLNKVKKYRPFTLPEIAFLATLEVGAGNPMGARKKFYEVLEKIQIYEKNKSDININYTELYCKLYISLINRTSDHAKYYNELKGMFPKEIISEYLPLPDEQTVSEFR